ncbi:hypothetical protein [Edaphobacillus lindanitolerans]|uniref:ABC-2 family transporter protein n=1 Tax=Edaphobacillus lindanitolerans TaxID=550447 RepID=A0A1U7PNU4_9BACI|nr:hypothetical protein [Edaphobacillus lindanitolerans]SIT79793.1 hypothetical protein SAMN05428946_1258 [Edaphobacillus lindanitolerans]
MINLLRYHMKIFFAPFTLLIVPLVYALNALTVVSINQGVLPGDLWHAAAFPLYIPINLKFDLPRWFIILLPYMMITTLYVQNELHHRFSLTLIRSGNALLWLNSMIVVIIKLIMVTTLAGFFVNLFAGVLFGDTQSNMVQLLPVFTDSSGIRLMIGEYFMMILSISISVLLNILFILFIGHGGLATLTVIILVSVSTVTAFLIPPIIPWLPLNSGMAALKEMNNFPLAYGLISGCVALAILVAVMNLVFKYKLEQILIGNQGRGL